MFPLERDLELVTGFWRGAGHSRRPHPHLTDKLRWIFREPPFAFRSRLRLRTSGRAGLDDATLARALDRSRIALDPEEHRYQGGQIMSSRGTPLQAHPRRRGKAHKQRRANCTATIRSAALAEVIDAGQKRLSLTRHWTSRLGESEPGPLPRLIPIGSLRQRGGSGSGPPAG
jgi:hypothetical protein